MRKFGVIAASLALMLALALPAMAGPWGRGMGPGYGMGYGYGMYNMMGQGYGMGPGYGMMGPGYGMMGPGNGWQAFSKEDIQKFQSARADFLKQTLAQRKALADKVVELQTEQAQPNPDQAKLTALYNKITDLRAEIAKKRNTILGEVPGGFGRGFGHGFGHHGFGPGGGFCGGYGPGAGWR